MGKALERIKKHYDGLALIAGAICLFVSSFFVWRSAVQFRNRLGSEPAPPPKAASAPAAAVELDRAMAQLQQPAQWKSRTRSGLFVPEKHFIGANGLPATLQNTQVHPPVPNDWFEKFNLPIQDADVLEQDPDGDGFTNLEEWQAGTDPANRESHPDYLTKLHLVAATEEPFPFVVSSPTGNKFGIKNKGERFLRRGHQMQLCEIIRVRLPVCGIGAGLPFLEIGEPVAVRILFKDVCVLNGQIKFLEPVIGHRWMHLGVLKGSRQAVGADEMFFRNKKARARPRFPLGGLLKLCHCPIQFQRCSRRRSRFGRWRGFAAKTVSKLNSVSPNEQRGNKKAERPRNQS